jgi:hypothetical protein
VIYFMTRGDGSGNGSSLPTNTTAPITTTSPSPTTSAPTATTAVPGQARDKFTVLRGGGNDVATVMIYICATDLESQGGMATADLNEIITAQDSDKVNIVIETGGTAGWRNNVISSRTNQRWYVSSQGLQLIQDNLGLRSMVDPNTLADFIRFSKANYPADRYMLVLWDHGGGSLAGYGFDQNFKNDSMTIDELAAALQAGGCLFDLVGFDACLMATLETAIAFEPYTDYMLASEETEPGIGWYYTDWISTLAQNSSVATTELGRRLIDDYVAVCQTQVPQSQATLSLIDLAELKGTVPASFAAFARSTSGLLDEQRFRVVTDARANTKEFGAANQINQIDLIDFAQRLGTPEAAAFADVLRSCIKYNRTSNNITNSNGVSIYFPYGRLTQLNSALATYDRIGLPAEYGECLRSFASVAAGGQITSGGSGNLLESLLGGLLGGGQAPSGGSPGVGGLGDLLGSFLGAGDFSSITGGGRSWLDVDRMEGSLELYDQNYFDASALAITEKDGQRVIALSQEQWDLVHDMELNIFLDDGEGFIDLGLDNVYEYNDDGDLIMEFDGTWLALNGQIVSYYLVSSDESNDAYSIRGRVPALLNDQLVDIILVFDNDNPDGVVLGAQPRYDPDTESTTVPKGLLEIVEGDKIDYLCDYYTYDGDYTDSYFLGEQYTATGEWTVENLALPDDMGYRMTYRFIDVFGNRYWTEAVSG